MTETSLVCERSVIRVNKEKERVIKGNKEKRVTKRER